MQMLFQGTAVCTDLLNGFFIVSLKGVTTVPYGFYWFFKKKHDEVSPIQYYGSLTKGRKVGGNIMTLSSILISTQGHII